MAAVSALGSVSWWGFSPGLDLISEVLTSPTEPSGEVQIQDVEDGTFHALLLGSSDPRHIVKTLAHFRSPTSPPRHRRGNGVRKVFFHVYEPCVELYARQMLLLTAAVADEHGGFRKDGGEDNAVSLTASSYLELSSNALVSPPARKFLNDVVGELLAFVVAGDGEDTQLRRIFDTRWLKHKEMDVLESVFKSWRNSKVSANEMRGFWDARVRAHLGERYDSREAVFDWDHSMKLSERHLQDVVGRSEYSNWRTTGTVWNVGNPTESPTEAEDEDLGLFSEQQTANPTLLAEAVVGPPGHRATQTGYWGDISSGPFATWAAAVDPAFPQVARRRNGKPVYDADDAAFWNLFACLYRLRFGSEPRVDDDEEFDFKSRSNPCPVDETNSTSDEDFQVVLLPFKNPAEFLAKPRFRSRFDAAVFSNGTAQLLPNVLAAGCVKTSGRVIVETVRSIVELNSEQCSEYVKRVVSLAESAGCKPRGRCDPAKDFFMNFDVINFDVIDT